LLKNTAFFLLYQKPHMGMFYSYLLQAYSRKQKNYQLFCALLDEMCTVFGASDVKTVRLQPSAKSY
jgi:hypothetical protein